MEKPTKVDLSQNNPKLDDLQKDMSQADARSSDKFLLLNKEPNEFITTIAQHRNWEREKNAVIPA